MGLFSFVGGLIGGKKAKKASRRAEEAQLEYLNKSLGLQEQQNEYAQQAFEPYSEAGTGALEKLLASMGLSGQDAQQQFLTGVQDSPVLANAIRSGTEGILQNASATGGVRGGNVQRGLADFNADQYVNEMLRQQSQLYDVSGMGLGATGQAVGFGQQYANNAGNILGQQGQVRAGGLLTRGGISNQQWNNFGSFLDQAAGTVKGGGGFGKIIGGLF